MRSFNTIPTCILSYLDKSRVNSMYYSYLQSTRKISTDLAPPSEFTCRDGFWYRAGGWIIRKMKMGRQPQSSLRMKRKEEEELEERFREIILSYSTHDSHSPAKMVQKNGAHWWNWKFHRARMHGLHHHGLAVLHHSDAGRQQHNTGRNLSSPWTHSFTPPTKVTPIAATLF